MHYRFAMIDMCDECRIPLEVQNAYMHDMQEDSPLECTICGRSRVYTKRVLTDYYVAPTKKSKDIKHTPRTIEEGFMLLALQDKNADRSKLLGDSQAET